MKSIMFIAPPAAGKGTQADLVVEKYNIPHISTGDILREVSEEDSEIGNYVSEVISNGGLVKDDIDGFPRNIEQAIIYDKILKNLNYKLGYVFLINIEEKELEKRITGRRICENCHAIYNINDENNSPKVESTCDLCGGRLYQRKDDNIEAFQNRYKLYLEKTEPIISHYREQGVLYEIDGNHSIDEVFAQVDNIISGDGK